MLHRLKSSFVLGSEQPKNVEAPKKKSVSRKVNPITGEVEGEASKGEERKRRREGIPANRERLFQVI